MGGPENGNFPLFYVVKMSLRRWVDGSKKPQTPLRNIKMAPSQLSSTLEIEILYNTPSPLPFLLLRACVYVYV